MAPMMASEGKWPQPFTDPDSFSFLICSFDVWVSAVSDWNRFVHLTDLLNLPVPSSNSMCSLLMEA